MSGVIYCIAQKRREFDEEEEEEKGDNEEEEEERRRRSRTTKLKMTMMENKNYNTVKCLVDNSKLNITIESANYAKISVDNADDT